MTRFRRGARPCAPARPVVAIAAALLVAAGAAACATRNSNASTAVAPPKPAPADLGTASVEATPGTRYRYEVEVAGRVRVLDLVLLPARGPAAVAVLSTGHEAVQFRARPSRLAEDLAAALSLDARGAVQGTHPRERPWAMDARSFASPAVVLARVRAGFPDRWTGRPFERGSRWAHDGIAIDVRGECEVAGRRGIELEISGGVGLEGSACFSDELALPLSAELRSHDGERWRARLTALRSFVPGPPPVAGIWADVSAHVVNYRTGYILRPDGTAGHFIWRSGQRDPDPLPESFCNTELRSVWRWDGARLILGDPDPGPRVASVWVARLVGEGDRARLHAAAAQWEVAQGVDHLEFRRIAARLRGSCEQDVPPSAHDRLRAAALPQDLDLEARDELGETPLSWAASRGEVGVVGELLRRGARMDVRNAVKRGPVASAAHRGHEEVLRTLLQREPTSDAEREDLDLALGLAARNGRLDLAGLLIERGAKVNRCVWSAERSCSPPLAEAAGGGNVAAVSFLLERGADPSWAAGANDYPGALLVAAQAGHDDVVALLLSRVKLSWRAQGNKDWPPLAYARMNRHLHVAGRLATAIGIDARLSTLRCDTETLRAVLAFAPDARYQARGQDDEGWSLIRRAIDCRDLALVEALLDAGADPDPLGPARERPLVRAVAHGSRDIVELLLARGARPSGTAAVEAAIAADRRDLYELVVRAGAPAAPGRPVAPEARKPGAAATGPSSTSSSPFEDEPDAACER